MRSAFDGARSISRDAAELPRGATRGGPGTFAAVYGHYREWLEDCGVGLGNRDAAGTAVHTPLGHDGVIGEGDSAVYSANAPAPPPHRHSVQWGAAALLLVLAVLGAICSCSSTANPTHADPAATGASPGLERFYTQQLAWTSCGHGFQCSALTVPLDYAHPGGNTLKIAIIRAGATDPAHRIGSLITDPGGPGVSGVNFVAKHLLLFGPRLRADFDIVGFDPRGVGASAPILCRTVAPLDQYNVLAGPPSTPSQVDALVARDAAFGAGCQARSGLELAFVGTPNAARDMDVLRAALGDPKMYYFGFSYGTELGAVYAGLFPTHLARAVLDGAFPPPDLSNTQQAAQRQQRQDLTRLAAAQTELTRFIADCVTHPDCPLGTDPTTAAQKLTDFVASADSHPLPTGTPLPGDSAFLRTTVWFSLYQSPNGWPQLRNMLATTMAGKGLPPGRIDSRALTAVRCLDQPRPVQTVADVRAELPAYQHASAFFGASYAWGALLCAYWPLPAQSQPTPLRYTGSPPILVVGTIHDPATPFSLTPEMAQQLGSAVVLTYNGDGHHAYGRGSTCIDTTVGAYLTQAVVPAAGTVCQPDPWSSPEPLVTR